MTEKRSSLTVEQLDSRIVPALDAAGINQVGGALTLTPDGLSDTDVDLVWTGPNAVDVTDSVNGNLGNFTGVTSLTYQNATAFEDEIAVDLGGNNVGASHTLNTGTGDDLVLLDNGTITGDVDVDTGEGNSYMVTSYYAPATVNGNVTISGGTGSDFTALGTLFNTTITGNLNIALGDGFNYAFTGVFFYAFPTSGADIGGNVTITGGANEDIAFLDSTNVTGNVQANLGEGFNYFGTGYFGPTNIDGWVSVTGGSANDLVNFSSFGDPAATTTINSFVSLSLGDGNNEVDIGVTAATTILGNVTAIFGSGEDIFNLGALGSVATGRARRLTLNTGGGNDDVDIDGEVGSRLYAFLGAGNDSFTYGANFTPLDANRFFGWVDGQGGDDEYDGTLVSTLINTRTRRARFETELLP